MRTSSLAPTALIRAMVLVVAFSTAAALMVPAVTQVVRHEMHPATNVGSLQPVALTGGKDFPCQSAGYTNQCYGPAQLRAAYAFQSLLNAGTDGSGRTIVIIDAFQDPTLTQDVKQFDNYYGLAAPNLTVISPFGLTKYSSKDSNQKSWSGEIALDVELAHAIAPGANIVLAEAYSSADSDLLNVQRYVIQNHLGDVVSMSFGEAEQCMDSAIQAQQHSLFAAATAAGITLVAASGDQGAGQLACSGTGDIKAVSTPASDPNVTAVGGTDMVADLTTGTYQSESVWNEAAHGSGGGGYSSLFARPAYQNAAVSGGARGLPDISYSGSRADDVLIAWNNGYYGYWGTSVGTPQIAALVALADQSAGRDLGNINPALYSAASSNFHDITSGNNSFGGVSGYSAAPGWDAASGLGSPVANELVPALG